MLALVIAAIGAVTLNYFFIKPYYSFTIDTSQGITAFVVYAASRSPSRSVAGQLREARARRRRIAQERAVQDVAIELLRGGDPATVLARGCRTSPTRSASARRRPWRARADPHLWRHPAMLAVEMPSARFHAAELPGGGRIVVDAGGRITREQQQVVSAVARIVGAGGSRPPGSSTQSDR